MVATNIVIRKIFVSISTSDKSAQTNPLVIPNLKTSSLLKGNAKVIIIYTLLLKNKCVIKAFKCLPCLFHFDVNTVSFEVFT